MLLAILKRINNYFSQFAGLCRYRLPGIKQANAGTRGLAPVKKQFSLLEDIDHGIYTQAGLNIYYKCSAGYLKI